MPNWRDRYGRDRVDPWYAADYGNARRLALVRRTLDLDSLALTEGPMGAIDVEDLFRWATSPDGLRVLSDWMDVDATLCQCFPMYARTGVVVSDGMVRVP